jgi:hypothetical protein
MKKRIMKKRQSQYLRVVGAVRDAIVADNGPVGEKGVDEIMKAKVPFGMLTASVKRILRSGLTVVPDHDGVEVWFNKLTWTDAAPYPVNTFELYQMRIVPTQHFYRQVWKDIYRKLRRLGNQFGGLSFCFLNCDEDPSPLPA